MAKRHTELFAAWSWICDECGREQWVRGIQLESEHLPEEAQDLLEDASWWVMYPEMVVCDSCETKFYVKQGIDDDAEGWEEEI
jgi:predicted nucleic acid-binding Zn ribbon protein